jgi:Uma2 family endonuclease
MTPSGPLTLKFRPGLRLSDRAFWKFCRANPELRLERTAQGELVVMSPAGSDSSSRNLKLGMRLGLWNEQSGLGIGFDSSGGFTFPNTAIRSPDLSWMTLDRWNAVPRDDRKKFAHVCPDFVAELRSQSDPKEELRDKMHEYIAQGVRLAWLIDPQTATVEVCRAGQVVEILERPETLSGEDVLPGFVLDLKGILYD